MMGRASKYGSTGKTVSLAELSPKLVEGFCLVCSARTSRRIHLNSDYVCSLECESKLNFDDAWRFAQVVKRLISKKCHKDIERAIRKELRRMSNEQKETV